MGHLSQDEKVYAEADLRASASDEHRPRMAASLIFEAMKRPDKSRQSRTASTKNQVVWNHSARESKAVMRQRIGQCQH